MCLLKQRVARYGFTSSRCCSCCRGGLHLGLMLSRGRHFLLVVRRNQSVAGKAAQSGHDLAFLATDDAAGTDADHAGGSGLEEGSRQLLGQRGFGVSISLDKKK